MNRNRVASLTIMIAAIAAMLAVSSWVSPGTIVPLQQPTSTLPAPALTPTEDSWIIVDLPANATQLEYGTEVYRLVCKACHGDKGQGLTDDWRAQWDPKDQNCWQSKCHALNHPSDGFYMPQVPPVVGPPLVMFNTALDLYKYNHQYMPWHDPASMTQKESWSVTAYILKINNIDPGPDLNPETAAQIHLRPGGSSAPAGSPTAEAAATHALAAEEERGRSPFWVVALLAAAALGVTGIVLLIRRLAARNKE